MDAAESVMKNRISSFTSPNAEPTVQRKTSNYRTDPFLLPFRRLSARRTAIVVPVGAEIGLEPGLIEKVAQNIVRRFNPVRIVLFGSRARGDARVDSDIDLFVEMETPLDRFERSSAVGAIFKQRPWAMDIVVYTPQETKRAIRNAGFLIDAIEGEGRTLYARG